MKDTEAAAILVRIEQTWPTPRWTQVALDDWRDDLMALDAGHAGTALVRIRQRVSNRPSWAEFKAEYAALSRFDGSKKLHCDWCDSTGWIPGGDHAPYCARGKDCRCFGLIPCECENGDGPRNIHRRHVAEHNRSAS